MTTITRWLIALCFALMLGCSWYLDGPDDTQAAQAVADDLADCVQQAKTNH
jgi:uncharacterized membrane protein affecting hemolysin expression